MVKKKKVFVNEEFCKGCGLCISVCPDDALKFKKCFNERGFHPVEWKGECRGCGQCYIICPDFAIEVKEDE